MLISTVSNGTMGLVEKSGKKYNLLVDLGIFSWDNKERIQEHQFAIGVEAMSDQEKIPKKNVISEELLKKLQLIAKSYTPNEIDEMLRMIIDRSDDAKRLPSSGWGQSR